MGKRVLIAEDAALIRTMLKEIIHSATEHTVVGEAENGIEAVDAYRTLKPDIVFMDAVMPVVSGMQALKEILRTDPDAKIIMCSAEQRPDDVIEALKIGAKDYILKPFDINRVVRCLEQNY